MFIGSFNPYSSNLCGAHTVATSIKKKWPVLQWGVYSVPLGIIIGFIWIFSEELQLGPSDPEHFVHTNQQGVFCQCNRSSSKEVIGRQGWGLLLICPFWSLLYFSLLADGDYQAQKSLRSLTLSPENISQRLGEGYALRELLRKRKLISSIPMILSFWILLYPVLQGSLDIPLSSMIRKSILLTSVNLGPQEVQFQKPATASSLGEILGSLN